MPKFRKKPVVIEARQLDQDPTGGSNWDAIATWIGCNGAGSVEGIRLTNDAVFIDTLEGEMRADPGDWIIRGVAGEFYPCKPGIFGATYDCVIDGPIEVLAVGIEAHGAPGTSVGLADDDGEESGYRSALLSVRSAMSSLAFAAPEMQSFHLARITEALAEVGIE